jgi:hypothetical protein
MIPTYLQTLGAVRGLLEKGEKFCAQAGLPPEEILEARLAPDMQPFTYQVKSTAVHSLGAIEGVRRGVFSPDQAQPPAGFAALASRIDATIDALRAIDPAEVEAFVGRDMRFVSGSRQLDFTAESFLLSFSQPNFFFHAATTYDILRWKGAPIGKRDFMGPMRRKS